MTDAAPTNQQRGEGPMSARTPSAVDQTVRVITASTLWQRELATADPYKTIDRLAELVEFYAGLHWFHQTVPVLDRDEIDQVTDILISRQVGGDELLSRMRSFIAMFSAGMHDDD